jgi:chemotaxis protein MotA
VDIASLAGILLALFMLVFGIISSAGVGGFREYLDPASAIITFGGAFSCTLMSMSLQNYIAGLKSFTLIFKAPALNTSEMIGKIIELSNVARKEGLLSLEEAATDLEEPFLKKGILLIVDGTDPELVRAIMETELVSVEGRDDRFLGYTGGHGPCLGYDRYPDRSGRYVVSHGRSVHTGTCNGSGVDYYIVRILAGKLDLYACFQ